MLVAVEICVHLFMRSRPGCPTGIEKLHHDGRADTIDRALIFLPRNSEAAIVNRGHDWELSQAVGTRVHQDLFADLDSLGVEHLRPERVVTCILPNDDEAASSQAT